MQTEFEAKFYPVNKDQIRAKLKDVEAELVNKEELLTILIFTSRSNNNFQDIDYIRLRKEFGRITFSAKRHARNGEDISAQKEIMTTVQDFDATVQILESVGLIADSYNEKYREVWELNGCEVVIDTCPDIEPYIEIEGVDEANVKETANLLGFSWSDAIYTSVIEIFAEILGITVEEALEKLKDWRF